MCVFRLLAFAIVLSGVPSPVSAVDPHVEYVAGVVEAARGRVERTGDGRSLALVDLSVPNAGPHDRREGDPYDAEFFEHLGHILTLESLTIIGTRFSDAWVPHIATLTNLTTLKVINNGVLTDEGMERLAALNKLERFVLVGTQITGRAYTKFHGFSHLVEVSHRGSRIDDFGLQALCENVPQLKHVSLAHANFTDAGAGYLARLVHLHGLEIGSRKATAAGLRHLRSLPLEYLQLGDGLDGSEGIVACREFPSLRRLSLTHCSGLDDHDLQRLAELRQLHRLELSGLLLPEERLPTLAALSFLRELRLISRPHPYDESLQKRVESLLPGVAVRFR